MGTRGTHDVDEGILHAALPRTRRSHPPRPARALRLGRRGRSPPLRRDGEEYCRRRVLTRRKLPQKVNRCEGPIIAEIRSFYAWDGDDEVRPFWAMQKSAVGGV